MEATRLGLVRPYFYTESRTAMPTEHSLQELTGLMMANANQKQSQLQLFQAAQQQAQQQVENAIAQQNQQAFIMELLQERGACGGGGGGDNMFMNTMHGEARALERTVWKVNAKVMAHYRMMSDPRVDDWVKCGGHACGGHSAPLGSGGSGVHLGRARRASSGVRGAPVFQVTRPPQA